MIYRSSAFESMNEAQAFSQARAKWLIPDDAWTESVDEGHYIAFFSNDAVACEAINARINANVYDAGEYAEVVERINSDGSTDWVESGRMITHTAGYPCLEWTPQRHTDFYGWQKVIDPMPEGRGLHAAQVKD